MNNTQHLQRDPTTWVYPPLEPNQTLMLKVSEHHSIYVEESGNPNGKPVIFLHGGPGGSSSPSHRQYFNPQKYRIIHFDQRGCGKSKPFASLEANTTWDLVADIEKIREHFKIEKWQVFGGSWGSTLAIAYSTTHPDRVTEIVLRGIFLLTKKELDWFLKKGGASMIFPEEWERFEALIPEAERSDMFKSYYKRLCSEDKKVALEAAKSWSRWEGSSIKLIPDPKVLESWDNDDFSLAISRIECHYFLNAGFMPENHLLSQVGKIRHIPTVIVHGRYDIVCPISTAWDLHKAFPEAEYWAIPDAGHAGNEPGISRALIAATDKFSLNYK